MTYAIAYVCLGARIEPDLLDDSLLPEDCESVEEALEELEGDIESFYSGSGPAPYICGIQLTGFDECTENLEEVRVAVNVAPTPEQISEAAAKMTALPEWLRGQLPPEPQLFIVWGTS